MIQIAFVRLVHVWGRAPVCQKYWFEGYRPKLQGGTNFSGGTNNVLHREESKIRNIGAAIVRNTQRMRDLNLLVFVEAIFELPLTVKVSWKLMGGNSLWYVTILKSSMTTGDPSRSKDKSNSAFFLFFIFLFLTQNLDLPGIVSKLSIAKKGSLFYYFRLLTITFVSNISLKNLFNNSFFRKSQTTQ